jgi:ATP-dependent DNA helicase RecQ
MAPEPPLTLPPEVFAVLRRYWGYDRFRPLQAEAIQAALQRRDSLVVLPTGGGKSLCYQVPAAVARRTDLVISPLIALMKDQVDALRTCGYPAAALHTGMSSAERQQVERDLLAGQLRLLFVAPERLQNPYLIGALTRVGLHAIAIDEAHCISHWGHDFRQDYRQLAALREHFPQASLHAYTATATQRVRSDICTQLRLRDPAVLVGSFDRPNLVFRIQPKLDVHAQVLEVLRRHPDQAAIVYCLSRKDTEELALYLRSQNIRAACYHAGLDADERRRTQDAFAAEKLDVIVATVAFGMGIDRSDVRCVIHASVPKSIEHYQQETGRAGRDGLEAECVLFYTYADIGRWEGLIDKSAKEADAAAAVSEAMRALLREMARLCGSVRCRHRALVEYFGQTYANANCRACDICLDEDEDLEDATVTAQKILSCVARVQERFGVIHVADVLLGEKTARISELGHDQLSTFGLLPEFQKKDLCNLIYQLVDRDLLARTADEYPILKLNDASWTVLRGQQTVKLRPPRVAPAPRPEPHVVRTTTIEADAWAGVDRGLFEHLRGVRSAIASEEHVPPFIILHDQALRDLARLRPSSADNLRGIRGLGQRKLQRFGERIRNAIAQYCREHGLGTDVAELGAGPRRNGKPRRRWQP